MLFYIEQGIELTYMWELLEERIRNSNSIKFDPLITDHFKLIEINNKLSMSEYYLEYVSILYYILTINEYTQLY